MADFVRFIRHLWATIKFLRGVILSLLALLIGCAIIIAVAEGMRIRTAIYFVFITALTIGYGDITPVTPLGRMASVAAGIIGVVSTGILIAAAVRALEASFRGRDDQSPRQD